MYLLDTNHCSGIIDGNETLLRKMDELGEVPIATSFITRAELLYMAFNSEHRDDNMQKVSDFLAGLNLYLVDVETIEAYARLKTDLIKHFGPRAKSARRKTTIRHVGFDDNDLWIAAIALRHDLTVVTSDSDFTRMQEASELQV